MTNTPEIWHTFEKQGERVLHTLRTRDTAAAKAMLAAPELLSVLKSLLHAVRHGNGNSAWDTIKEHADATIAKAEGGAA